MNKLLFLAIFMFLALAIMACGDNENIYTVGPAGPKGDTGETGQPGNDILYNQQELEVTESRGVSPTPLDIPFNGSIIVPLHLIAPTSASTSQQGWITLTLGSKRLCYQRRNNPTSSTIYDFKYAKTNLLSGGGDLCSDNNNYSPVGHAVQVTDQQQIIISLDSPQIPNNTPVSFIFTGWSFE
jgi:hypothetical protein